MPKNLNLKMIAVVVLVGIVGHKVGLWEKLNRMVPSPNKVG